jgi:hypothetical protein
MLARFTESIGILFQPADHHRSLER